MSAIEAVNGFLFPVLQIGAGILIPIIALALSTLITYVYKWTTNQKQMGELKAKQKTLQKELRTLKSEPEKMMAKNKELMEINMKYMKSSMKSTFYTLIPLFLIFGWMSATFSYIPIAPGDQFSVDVDIKNPILKNVTILDPKSENGFSIISDRTSDVTDGNGKFLLKANNAGTYIIQFRYGEKDFTTRIKISKYIGQYINPVKKFDELTITVGLKKLHPYGNLSIFGWHPGWLGTYIICSIIFSMLLRRFLKLH